MLRDRLLLRAGLEEASALALPETPAEYGCSYRDLAGLEDDIDELLGLDPRDPIGNLYRGVLSLVVGDDARAATSLGIAASAPDESWAGTQSPSHAVLVGLMALACIRTAVRELSSYGAKQLVELVDWGCPVSFAVLVEASTLLHQQNSEQLLELESAVVQITDLTPKTLRSLRMLFDGTTVWSLEDAHKPGDASAPLRISRLAQRLSRN